MPEGIEGVVHNHLVNLKPRERTKKKKEDNVVGARKVKHQMRTTRDAFKW